MNLTWTDALCACCGSVEKKKGTGLPVPVPDYFRHGCINSWLRSLFLCQSVSAFSGRHVVSRRSGTEHGDAPGFRHVYRSRKYWEDQRCALVSSWLPNELNSASCVRELHDHNRAQSESRVRKKAEVGGGVERFYTIMLLHLKVEPCTVKLQNNSNC